ncbi:response regulator [Flavisolibacter sp. BT320]|nr:response regulator [Flavisolibacter longurius]
MIIITDKPERFTGLKTAVRVIDCKSYIKECPETWELYSQEYVPHVISSSLTTEHSLIAIDFDMSICDKFLVGHHILSSNGGTIVYFSEYESSVHGFEDVGLFRTKGIQIITKKKLLEAIDDEENQRIIRSQFQLNFDYNNYKDLFRKLLVVDRHQATNEWGTVKLLYNHGLTLGEIERVFELPKTVYFKQKLKEYEITDSSVINYTKYFNRAELEKERKKFAISISKCKKILLIDDNGKKGWQFALGIVFSEAIIDVKVNFEDANDITDFSEYNIIFLDLRLPQDQQRAQIDIKNGFKLIEKIKNDESSLHIPLIVFTASQRAHTLDKILNLGADAMYVKDSPESSQTDSLDNYYDFISEINFQLEKAEVLKQYWVAIVQIKNSLLPEVVDTANCQLKSRIIERLEMFYGLMKKRYEEFAYNTDKFHFSSDVLSFMTLWSILNEVQECYFTKQYTTLDIIWDYRSKTYTPLTKSDPSDRRNRINYKYLQKWHVKGQPQDIYFERINISIRTKSSGGFRVDSNGDYLIDSDVNCYLSYNSNRAPHYSTRDSLGNYLKTFVSFPEQKLSFQIAFLLLEKQQLSVSSKQEEYLKILKNANDQRNRLYITHGEESNSFFHSQLEKDKSLPSNATWDLFRLIFFLLTGDDSKI